MCSQPPLHDAGISEAPTRRTVQAQVFARFKVFLNMPAGADGLDHLWQRGARWGKDEVVGLLSWIGEAAAHEQPVASISFPLVQDGDARPVKEPGAFGPLTHRETLPLLVMQHEGFHFADFHLPAPSVRR